MIRVTVVKSSEQYRSLVIKGHAEYAESGQDIICASVSVLAVNTLNAIESFTKDEFEAVMNDGCIEANFYTSSSDTKLLMDTFVLGIESIIQEYGDSYIHLEIKEV